MAFSESIEIKMND